MPEEKLVSWQPLIAVWDSMNPRRKLIAGTIILAIVAGLIYFAFWAIPWSKFGVAEWAYWVGAIGTVGTLLGTIRLATTETRRHILAEQRRAHLCAAAMLLRLMRATVLIKCTIANLDLYAEIDHAPDVILQAKQHLMKIDIWNVEELMPLAPLSGDSAFQLAEACSEIRCAFISFDNAENGRSLRDPEARKSFCKELSQLLRDVARKIEDAYDSLNPRVQIYWNVNRGPLDD